MQVPPFPRPSKLSDVVYFRVPNVNDALTFCNISDEQEEVSSTQYLNHIQDVAKQGGEINDSAKWTGEDRRTALWWIFIHTHRLPEATVKYECKHCEEDHYINVMMPNLAENTTAFEKLPEYTFDALIDGRLTKGIKVHPLSGSSCEALEAMRGAMLMHEEGSKAWNIAHHQLDVSEIAHSVTFPDQPSDEKEAIGWKVDKLLSMALDTEFRSFVAHVETGLRKQRHGLLTDYKDGRYSLIINEKNCEKAVKAGEGESKLLLIPFRPNDYIATL